MSTGRRRAWAIANAYRWVNGYDPDMGIGRASVIIPMNWWRGSLAIYFTDLAPALDLSNETMPKRALFIDLLRLSVHLERSKGKKPPFDP